MELLLEGEEVKVADEGETTVGDGDEETLEVTGCHTAGVGEMVVLVGHHLDKHRHANVADAYDAMGEISDD